MGVKDISTTNVHICLLIEKLIMSTKADALDKKMLTIEHRSRGFFIMFNLAEHEMYPSHEC